METFAVSVFMGFKGLGDITMRASGIAHEIECVVKNALGGCDAAIQGNDRFQAMADLSQAKRKLLHLATQVRQLVGEDAAIAS